MAKKNHNHTSIQQELCRDFNTLKRLSRKQRLIFLWDYYKWRILVCICTIAAVFSFARILWEGQKPCRLRICVVLDTEYDCSSWFSSFTEELQSDGNPGSVDINFDQGFDRKNPYNHIQEMEILTTVSSGLMDAAVCGEDLYRYLLSINACLSLKQGLSADLYESLESSGRLVYDRADLRADEYGAGDGAGGIGGYYAVDLTESKFGQLYHQTGKGQELLYMVIISNTEHLADCECFIRAIAE